MGASHTRGFIAEALPAIFHFETGN